MSMIPEVVANVEVFTGTAKAGPKAGQPFYKYTLIMASGTKYSCNFDKPACAAGDTITFNTLPPNQYSNGQELVQKGTIAVAAKSAGPVVAPIVASPARQGGFNTVFPVPQDHDRIATLRVAALASAVAHWSREKGGASGADHDKVIETAYLFAQFISGALDKDLVEQATNAALGSTDDADIPL